MKKFHITPLLPAAGAATLLASCATTPPPAKLDSRTEAVLGAMSTKLADAKTVRVHAARTAPPGIHAGGEMAESAAGTVTVRRPDKLFARMKTGQGGRSIGFDAGTLTVVDQGAGTHALVKAPHEIDAAVRSVHEVYGVMPPVAGLLVNDPRAFLLDGVESGVFTGRENTGGVECDKMVFRQDGLTWTLWVSTADSLPRKITQSYPNGEGGPPLTVTASLANWELNPVLSGSELTAAIPAGSRAVDMIPLQP